MKRTKQDPCHAEWHGPCRTRLGGSVLAEHDARALLDLGGDRLGRRDGRAGRLRDRRVGGRDHGRGHRRDGLGLRLGQLAVEGDGGGRDPAGEETHVEHDDAGHTGDAVGAATQRATAGVEATERDAVTHYRPTL